MESKRLFFFFRASNVFFFFRRGIASKFVGVLWISTCWIYHPHREINRAKWRFTGIPKKRKDIMSPQDFAWKTHRFSSVLFLPHAALVMNMAVSEKGGTSKSSILIGFSIINHPFWGTTIFGNTHIGISFRMEPLRSDPIRIRGAPNVWKVFFFQTPPGPVSVAGNVGVYRVLYLYTLR